MRSVNTSGDIPLPRQFHSTVVYQDSIFLYGGYNGNDFSNFYQYQISLFFRFSLQSIHFNNIIKEETAMQVLQVTIKFFKNYIKTINFPLFLHIKKFIFEKLDCYLQ
jgi:hypothetical protein